MLIRPRGGPRGHEVAPHRHLSMANWQLGGHGELTEPATVRLPSMLENVDALPSAILAHLGWRLATKETVNSALASKSLYTPDLDGKQLIRHGHVVQIRHRLVTRTPAQRPDPHEVLIAWRTRQESSL